VIPGFEPPQGSLSTTVALAVCVLVAVPLFGYFKRARVGLLPSSYAKPTFIIACHLIFSDGCREPWRSRCDCFGQYDERRDDQRDITHYYADFLFPIVMTLLGFTDRHCSKPTSFYFLATCNIAAANPFQKTRSPTSWSLMRPS